LEVGKQLVQLEQGGPFSLERLPFLGVPF
jgi:hypothetical protein